MTTDPGAPWPPEGLPVLDARAIATLRELEDEDSPELLAETTRVFVADAEVRMRELDQGVSAGRMEETRKVAHALRGAALVMGASRLAVACGGLESAASAGRCDVAGVWRARIAVEYRLATDALRREAALNG